MSSSQSSEPRNVILVAIDMSPDASRVLGSAVELARGAPGSELHLVHAFDSRSGAEDAPSVAEAYAALVLAHSEFLDARAREARTSGATVTEHLCECEPERAILQTAASIDADAIVMGPHGRHGFARWLLGSVADAVMRNATCPVWVVRAREHETPLLPESPGLRRGSSLLQP